MISSRADACNTTNQMMRRRPFLDDVASMARDSAKGAGKGGVVGRGANEGIKTWKPNEEVMPSLMLRVDERRCGKGDTSDDGRGMDTSGEN